jgi:hypothetical protein
LDTALSHPMTCIGSFSSIHPFIHPSRQPACRSLQGDEPTREDTLLLCRCRTLWLAGSRFSPWRSRRRILVNLH